MNNYKTQQLVGFNYLSMISSKINRVGKRGWNKKNPPLFGMKCRAKLTIPWSQLQAATYWHADKSIDRPEMRVCRNLDRPAKSCWHESVEHLKCWSGIFTGPNSVRHHACRCHSLKGTTSGHSNAMNLSKQCLIFSTTCLLHVIPPCGTLDLNDSWSVNLT